MPEPRRTQLSNPFPGLRPFRSDEHHLFFGREDQVDSMIAILATRRFLAVVGSSGSGKSSLVHCGLEPALHQGLLASAGSNWRIARFRPEHRPIQNLAKALAKDGVLFSDFQDKGLSLLELIESTLRLSTVGLLDIVAQASHKDAFKLLLVVDQFEELFRYRQLNSVAEQGGSSFSEEATAFVSLLLAVLDSRQEQIHIVLTMRSDFLGDCTLFPGLAEVINRSLYLVPRLTREERRAAITNPVLVAGATISPVLVTRLVNDVGDNPDQLSILQHALRRTWSYWHGLGGQGPITVAHYAAIGTMARALNSHAKETLDTFREPERLRLSERLFRALTDKATDPRGIRRPTTLADLRKICGGEASTLDELIDHFRGDDRAFLMPPISEPLREEAVIDISHESLMRLWDQLKEWADQEAKDAALYQRLAFDAKRYKRRDASLWRDPELQEAIDWREREKPTKAWGLRYADNFDQAFDFLEQSRKAREDELRRQKLLQRGMFAILLAFSVLGAISFRQWQSTRLSQARAYAAIAAATLEQRPLQSMLYSLAALERLDEDPAEALGAYSTLARATLRNWEIKRWYINLQGAGRQPITALLALRNGKAISAAGCALPPAQGDPKGAVCLQRWQDSIAVGPPFPTGQRGEHQQVGALLELADGRLVSGATDGTLRLWQLEPSLKPLSPALSALTAASGTATESAPGAEPRSRPAIHSLVQLTDGEIVSGDVEGGLRRWRLVGQGQGSRLEPLGEPISTDVKDIKLLALPNGALLSGGAEPIKEIGGSSVRLWRQGRPIGTPLRTGQGVVKQLLIWNDQVLSLGSEGTVVRLNPATRTRQPLFDNNTMGKPYVERLAVVAGGRALISLHSDGTLRLWQDKGPPAATVGMNLLATGQSDSKQLLLLEALRDGWLLAADSNDQLHLIRVPDPGSGESDRTGTVSSGHQAVNALLAVSDDRLVSGDQATGKLCFWKLGHQLETLHVRLRGASGPCLTGNLGGSGADQVATGVLLAPLQKGALLSVTNLLRITSSGAGMNSIVLQRWQQGTNKRAEDWTVEPLATPKSWRTITSIEPAGTGDLLTLGFAQSYSPTGDQPVDPPIKFWRWNPLQPATPPRQIRTVGSDAETVASSSLRAVPLPGGDWLTVSSAGGALQRWRAQAFSRLRISETIETGLDAIGTLAVLPGGRYAVIASDEHGQEEGLVQVFDLQEKTWVGQPIQVPRPLGEKSGKVAATALAILPEGGLAIGTNRNRANLLVIQPRRILEKACHELESLLDNGNQQQRSSSPLQRRGMPPTVIQLSREACKRHSHR
jgi:WD40 repeat protein